MMLEKVTLLFRITVTACLISIMDNRHGIVYIKGNKYFGKPATLPSIISLWLLEDCSSFRPIYLYENMYLRIFRGLSNLLAYI